MGRPIEKNSLMNRLRVAMAACDNGPVRVSVANDSPFSVRQIFARLMGLDRKFIGKKYSGSFNKDKTEFTVSLREAK